MYSTVGLIKNPKHSGKLTGTHQQIDQIARKALGKFLPKRTYFPSAKEIVYFEGMRGPDGLKRKSPGVDEPQHFILPDNDDGKLIKIIEDHQYNLREALEAKNEVRAAFEAAWLAHAITDGLTPAHHFPLSDMTKELMSDKEFVKIFGEPIKGIMRGKNPLEFARNNWLYWGAGGYMSKHVVFEYGIAITVTSLPHRALTPKLTKKDLKNVDLKKEFYSALKTINKLDLYRRFQKEGWTTDIALASRRVLVPEIVRLVTLAWASAIPALNEPKKSKKSKKDTKKSKKSTKKPKASKK